MPLPNTAHLYGTDPVPTWAQHLAALETFYNLLRQGTGQQDVSELTIAAGAVTPTRGEHVVDTEADAGSDDLATIATTNFVAGQWLMLGAAHTDRTIVVKHAAGGAGQINLQGAADFSLDETGKWILLKRVGSDWVELLRNEGLEPIVSHKVVAWSSDQTAGTAHRGRTIVYTGATVRTLSFAAVATLTDGWFAFVRNDMTAILTLDPNGSEAIDGATTLRLFPGDSTIVACDGTALRSYGLSRTRTWRRTMTGAGSITTADHETLVEATTGTWTLSIGAIAGFPAGFRFAFRNGGSGTITIDPNSSETIDGAATIAIAAGESCLVVSDGSQWKTLYRVAGQPAGTIVGRSHASTASVISCGNIPIDNSIPQSGEGTEILTVAHTPKATTNRLIVRAALSFGKSTSGNSAAMALFKDSESGARQVAFGFNGATDGVLMLEYEMEAGTVSAITFKIRAGAHAGSMWINADDGGTRMGGGVMRATITVEEIKA